VARIAGTSSDDTRERILDAARAEFTERTYAGTTIKHIAEKAGVTTAALYYHFASKEAMLEAVVAPAIEALSAYAREVAAAQPVAPAELAELVHRLVAVQAGNINVFRVLIRDPSAVKALGDEHQIKRVMGEVERALAGTDDPLVLLRHRCALGAINGGLVLSAHARERAEGPAAHSHPLTFSADELRVIAESALAVLHVLVGTGAEGVSGPGRVGG
jgi:AcrR family transcriptional regulator